MGMYAIKDTTLTAIGDAIRLKKDGLKVAPYVHKIEALTYTSGTATNNLTLTTDEIDDLNGISITPWIKVRVNSITNWQENGWSIYYTSNSNLSATYIDYNTTFPIELYCRYSWITFRGYHTPSSDNPNLPLPVLDVEIWACNEDKEPYFYTPLEMANIINEFSVVPDEAFNISGDIYYKFAYNCQNWLIDRYGDKIRTENLTNINHLFYYSKNLTRIPFELNCHPTKQVDADYACCASGLTELPIFNNFYPKLMAGLFRDTHITEIPDEYGDNWQWDKINSSSMSMSELFGVNSYLRYISPNFLKKCYTSSTGSTNQVWYGATSLTLLDEIKGLPVKTNVTVSGSMFSTGNFFPGASRLKNIEFDMNEDGTPKIAKWKNQNISIRKGDYIGYHQYSSGSNNELAILKQELGEENRVTNDETYHALKDTADWWTSDIKYSRYNRISAVNTINSLPDTSAYLATQSGATNTINFNGSMGSLTDGGAINTLTEEEIAVATAKGWTVAFVTY